MMANGTNATIRGLKIAVLIQKVPQPTSYSMWWYEIL